jgi:hypothetical protein
MIVNKILALLGPPQVGLPFNMRREWKGRVAQLPCAIDQSGPVVLDSEVQHWDGVLLYIAVCLSLDHVDVLRIENWPSLLLNPIPDFMAIPVTL